MKHSILFSCGTQQLYRYSAGVLLLLLGETIDFSIAHLHGLGALQLLTALYLVMCQKITTRQNACTASNCSHNIYYIWAHPRPFEWPFSRWACNNWFLLAFPPPFIPELNLFSKVLTYKIFLRLDIMTVTHLSNNWRIKAWCCPCKLPTDLIHHLTPDGRSLAPFMLALWSQCLSSPICDYRLH